MSQLFGSKGVTESMSDIVYLHETWGVSHDSLLQVVLSRGKREADTVFFYTSLI